MQRLELVSVQVALHALYILGGTLLCLSALAFAGNYLVWRGLDFPVTARDAVELLGMSGISFSTGGLIYWYFRDRF